MQNGNLTILDPIWTTAYVTRNHGYLIYDTLFALDENNDVKPQMVDKYEVSADKTLWTFTLRDGLEWHDGKPVTAGRLHRLDQALGRARRRWARSSWTSSKEFKAVDAKTFTMKLKEPYGLVLDSLGKPSLERAVHDAQGGRRDRPVQADRQPDRLGPVHLRQRRVQARREARLRQEPQVQAAQPSRASGLAGGKVVKVDRVEIIEMPDPQQQVNALIAGEIDLIEQPPHDLIPILKKDKSVKLVDWNPLGQQFIIRFNHLQPSRSTIRRSAWPRCYAMRQEDYLKATVGEPEYYKVCGAAFICGTPNAVDAPNGLLVKPDFEKSKALLKEAGYDGTPVVLMQSTTLPVLTNIAPVTKALLEQGGFKVDMQSMDWQTLVTRRTKKDPPDKGGWNVFHTFSVAADILNPISNSYMVANGDKAWFGWPTDPEMEKLRDAYAKETDPAKAKALAARGAGPRASRPRSTAGSASGTDRAPCAPTSAAG